MATLGYLLLSISEQSHTSKYNLMQMGIVSFFDYSGPERNGVLGAGEECGTEGVGFFTLCECV